MASIIERKGRFTARVRRQGFPLTVKTFTRRSDAVAWARRVEADMESGRWAHKVAPATTLAAAVDEYRRTAGTRFKGAADYAYRYEEFKRLSFAGSPLDKVTARDLATWRDDQLTLHKPATVVRKLAMLSAIFTWAIKERGWLTSNPLSLVTRPRVADARERVLSEQEHHYLMRAARSSRAVWLAPALTILLRSAMRRGDLVSLTVGAIDFEASVAFLGDTKNGSARRVPLCPVALASLKTLAEQAKARGDGALIPVTAAGSVSTCFVRTLRRARRLYEQDCAAQGSETAPDFLTDARLHDLRHCAVTDWAATGALTLPELMAVSGHKTPRMLVRYVNLQASAIASKLATLRRELNKGAAQ